MPKPAALEPEVYTARELAAAARRDPGEMTGLIDRGLIATVDGKYVAHAEALRVLRALASGRRLGIVVSTPPMFSRPARTARETRVPLVASTAIHGTLFGALLLIPFLGRAQVSSTLSTERPAPVRLVFLATPGPGGGGGGSGLREPRPPAPARRAGRRQLSSPVPAPAPPPVPAPDPLPPPPRAVEPPPRAPVAASPADAETAAGVVEDSTAKDSRGAGTGGSAGTGTGTGIGAGEGAGIGDGSGGGTGGGPYRAGSGIEPPTLLREVKPEYPEDARRRSVEGDVVLEIVVRRDGTVGEVRLLQGLGYGLDARAIQAVRQWRFEPARRKGVPVDVLVEVSVEFKLR